MKNKNEEAILKAKFEATEESFKKAAKAAKTDTHNLFIYNECIKLYKTKMEKELEDTKTYYSDGSLHRIHDSAKNKAMAQVYTILELQNSGNSLCFWLIYFSIF